MTTEQRQVRQYVSQLRKARRFKFPESGHDLACPARQGVYLIYDPQGRVAHVGRTLRARNGLLTRLRNHLHGQSSFVELHLKRRHRRLRRGYAYAWVEVRNPRRRALVEALATGLICPKHIGTGASTRR